MFAFIFTVIGKIIPYKWDSNLYFFISANEKDYVKNV